MAEPQLLTKAGPLPLRQSGDLAHVMTRPLALVLLGFGFIAIMFARHPSVLLHAELWGDDGWSWYPDAYYFGAVSLLKPVNGYLNSFQRLVALAFQPVPLAWIPTLFAAVALIAQALPCVFLVSARMALAWPCTWARLAFALLYVMLPNSFEIAGNLTNAQWHLAVLALLILVSAPPRGTAGWCFDLAILLLSGVSGPFCLLLLPVAAWELAEKRSRVATIRIALVAATAAVQLGFLFYFHRAQGAAPPLGAGPRLFARIVGQQILVGAELGFRHMSTITALPLWQNNVLPVSITLAAAALGGVALWRGDGLLRKAFLFAALLFGAALISPKVSNSQPQWHIMTSPLMGDRYYILPMLVWFGMLFSLAAERSIWLRAPAVTLLLLAALIAVPADWRYVAMPRTDFVARAEKFAHAKPGTRMEFALHPPGLTPMVLVKKAASE